MTYSYENILYWILLAVGLIGTTYIYVYVCCSLIKKQYAEDNKALASRTPTVRKTNKERVAYVPHMSCTDDMDDWEEYMRTSKERDAELARIKAAGGITCFGDWDARQKAMGR